MHHHDKLGEKMLGIEFLRFFSAISVLIFHYKNFTYQGLSRFETNEATFPFYEVLRPFYEYGDYGVQIFWCISGFIFFWKYQQAIANGTMGGKRFLILRFSRLYPLHVATLVYVAIVQFAYTDLNGESFACKDNDAFHFVLHLLMASNWRGKWGLTFNAPIWSVSVEVLIYALFFILLRIGLRSFAVSLFIVAACVWARHHGVDSRVIACISFFYAGGLAAQFNRLNDGPHNRSKSQGKTFWISVFVAGLAPILYLSHGFQDEHGNGELLFLNLWTPVLVYSLAQLRVPEHGLMAKALEGAGNMTYASYLLHFPLQLTWALYFLHQGRHAPANSASFCLAYLLSTLILSALVYRYFEVPAQQRIRTWWPGASTPMRSDVSMRARGAE